MGNSTSAEQKPASPAHSASGKQPAAKRKESSQTLSQTSTRSNNPSPATSLLSTSNTSPSTTQSTKAHAHATGTSSPAATHTRARSITSPIPVHLKSEDRADNSKSGSPKDEAIRPTSRASTLPVPVSAHATPPREIPDASQPVDVPQTNHQYNESEDLVPSGLPDDDSPYGHVTSTFSRPPRLPLPIEEEAHTPGSPIISPHDVDSLPDEKESEGVLPRRSSVLSSTTVDDDEIGEHDLYQGESSGPTVPTVIEWKGAGEKIYVTGTFVMWERKFKLHRNKETGFFSTTLQLKPGTHHIKFLVDDDMITSNDIPTTVDFTNILVNYVEIVAPFLKSEDETVAKPTEPVPIPGTAITEGQAKITDQPDAQANLVEKTQDGPAPEQAPISPQPASVTEPVTIPASVPRTKPSSPSSKPATDAAEDKPRKQFLPRAEYTKEIPAFLMDLDRYATPEDERFLRASRVTSTMPHPPSLPLFLAKSILNGATPHKDDASVLIMPNHTVLNHLATSSIRSGVLATSGTTRYKRKFLTTIMYRPTSDDG